MLAGRTRSSI